MNAEHAAFWEYDIHAELTCAKCGWIGAADGHEEPLPELVEVRCGGCETLLLVVPFPTFDETRAAAAKGNRRAIAALPEMEAQEAEYLARHNQPHLSDRSQLPELPGESLVITWDQVTVDEEQVQILLHDGVEIWREPAYWESINRFEEVVDVLRSRYGSRLTKVEPTDTSTWWLYGDKIGARSTVERINSSLTSSTEVAGLES